MKKQEQKINSEMLSLAREYRCLTQGELAKQASITQSLIAKIENGIKNSASEETVLSLANALNFPIEFLKLEENTVGFGSSSVFYRKKSKLTSIDRKVIQSKVNLHRIALKRMLNAVNLNPKYKINVFYDEDITPEEASKSIRSSWNIPDGQINNLTTILERAGIVIIECDFGTNHIDGTSIWNADMPPIIFVNKNLTADRYRFTLAHEFGHLVLHEQHSEEMENEADAFASSFLMPKEFFVPYVAKFNGNPKLHELSQLKPLWKVSIAAMIERMYQLNLITQEKRKVLYIMMNQRKIRQIEPNAFLKEKPTLLDKIFKASVVEASMSKDELPLYFRMPDDCIKDLYFSFEFFSENEPQHHLRIV